MIRYVGEKGWQRNRRLAQEALDDPRTKTSGQTARCPCLQCEGERGKRDGKLSMTVNLQSTGFFCHRCGLSGFLDKEQGELNAKVREYLTGTVPERTTEREFHHSLDALRVDGRTAARWLYDPSEAYDWEEHDLREIHNDFSKIEKERHFTAKDRHDIVLFSEENKVSAVSFLILSGTEPSVNDDNGSYAVRHKNGYTLPGRLKGWVMRSINQDVYPGPKYRNAPGMIRAECFFNERAVYKTSRKPLVVVEGCFDALSRGDDGVAVLGKLSHWQKERLIAAPRPVLIVPDGDAWEAGRMDAMEIAHYGQTAGFLKLPAGKDPDEYGDAEWEKMVKERAEWF